MDRTLLNEFREAVIKLDQSFKPETVEKVHSILLPSFTMQDAMNLYVVLASYLAYKRIELWMQV
jgi:hypothetical protein